MEVLALQAAMVLLAVVAGGRWARRRRGRTHAYLTFPTLLAGPPCGRLRRRNPPVVQFGPPPLLR
ncbi:MAG: hypothetical protein IT204_06635 [Fimbriimonadaceae bacterium]|nr:hypothetical protein [Fimbriimonadaceae bacterium]